MNKFLFTLSVLFSFLGLRAQNIIELEFDGHKGVRHPSGEWPCSECPGTEFYRQMNYYNRSFVFFRYSATNKKSLPVRFKALHQQIEDSANQYWTTIEKYSNENESNAWIFDPNDEDHGFSQKVSINVYSASRMDYEKTTKHSDHISDFSYKVVQPEWLDQVSEIRTICRNSKPIQLKDYFKDGIDVDFRLDGPGGEIIKILDPKSISVGEHTIWATKAFDNGFYAEEIPITILHSSELTFSGYIPDIPIPICFNAPSTPLYAYADEKICKGIWSGAGTDADGNFNPSEAGLGIKHISFKHTNKAGCESTAEMLIDVKPVPAKPTVEGKTSGCINETVTLTASVPPTMSDVKFLWYRTGENTPFFTGDKLVHIIRGNEKITVKAVGAARCESDEKANIEITSYTPKGRIANTIPQKDLIKQGASLGFKFIPEETREYTYAWDFGDGETSSEKEPIHFFSKAGEFTVKVLVEDIEKCQNTITYEKKIKVDEFPHWITKTASLNNSCNNIDPIDIFDYFSLDERHVKITDFSGIKFHLDNDTELSSNIIDITSLSPGIHKVTASKTYPSKKFEEYFTFKIKPSPQITFGEYPKGICQTEPTFLIPVLVDGKKAAGGIWTGLGIDPAGYFNPKEAGLGVKKLSYSFTNKEGCTETEEIDIDVRAVPATPIITGKTTGCISEVITLKASALNASQFAWYKTGEVEPFFHGDKLDYTIIKTEELYVKALNSEFCPSTSSLPISITCFAPLGKISTTENTIKQHEMLSFTFHPADGTQAKEYLWNFGDGFKSTKAGVTQHYYNKAGTFTVTLKVQSPEGCDNIITYEKQIKVEEIHTPETEKPTFPPYVATPKTPLKLNVFPNPFKDWIKLTVDSPIDDVAYVRMYNQNGWLMYQKTLDIKKGENEIVLNDFQNLTTIIWNLKIDAKSFNINEIFLKED